MCCPVEYSEVCIFELDYKTVLTSGMTGLTVYLELDGKPKAKLSVENALQQIIAERESIAR